MALSSTAVVKVIIVTDNLERTAAAYEKLLGSRVDLVSSRILPSSLGFAHRVCREAVPV